MWFNKEVPAEKPLGLDTTELQNNPVETQSEQAQEVKERPKSLAEVRAAGEQRKEKAKEAVGNFKDGVAGKAKGIWAKVAGFGGRSKEALGTMANVALAPDVAAQFAYDKVATKTKEGYELAMQGAAAGKEKIISAGEAVANKATEKYNDLEQRAVAAKDKLAQRVDDAVGRMQERYAAHQENTLMKQFEEARQMRDDLEDRMQAIMDKLEELKINRSAKRESLPGLAME